MDEYRYAYDNEFRITYDEDGEVRMADTYLCETCNDLFWSVKEAGYCVTMEKGYSLKQQVKDMGEYL